MKINNIKINSYGILKEKEIKLENKLNIIYGKNEKGKSTLLNYIKNIFYGISKNKNGKEISDYEKYNPWIGEEFSGKLKYELDNGKEFEIFRDFNKKNPKVFNSNLEDISSEFEIDKKDGNQFFHEQTGIDEKTYLSTIMSTQQEIVLDRPSQNILLQKVANLAGTGDDKVSFQKAMDKLNKKQLEEVGGSRTQDRPINLVQKRMSEITVVLKDEEGQLERIEDLKKEKYAILENLKSEKEKNNSIRKINMLTQKNEINLEKSKLKNKMIEENNKKIENLIQEKNKLIKNNEEKNELNNKKEIKNKLNKNNIILLIIFLLIIVINIFNFIFIKNKIINYILIILIPIIITLFFINYLKNKKIKNKLENDKLKNELEKQKQQENINIINSQINLLKNEIGKQEKEVEEENKQNEQFMYLEKQKIVEEYSNIDILYLMKLKDKEEVNFELEKSNKNITNYELELNRIEYEEKNSNNKLEEIVPLKEEYSNLEEQLYIIEEKNECIQKTKEFLEKAYTKMKQSVTPKFTQNLSNLICKISNGKYKKVSINEENGLIVELENGEYVPANLLSVGTIDQLYLSLRLAMIEELSSEKMPIILDEAFAYFDDERLKNSLLFLAERANEHQIILFTCTKREKEILEQLNIKYEWIEL